MTTEQKEAIDNLEKLSEYGLCYTINEKNIVDIETVLNLIQEQEKELKRLDKEAQQYFETTIKQAQTFDSQLQKKDKMIDLILDVFFKRFTAQLVLEYGIENKEQLKQKFKQFYERKVEDESNDKPAYG